jgi:hypothetical protein
VDPAEPGDRAEPGDPTAGEAPDEEQLELDSPDDEPVDDQPGEGGSAPGTHTGLPPRMEAWRRRSAVGAILTGFAFGLQEALEPKRDEPVVMVQTSGAPPKDLPVEAEFEYRRPRQSVVQIRPWLLGRDRDADPGDRSADLGDRSADLGDRSADEEGGGAWPGPPAGG